MTPEIRKIPSPPLRPEIVALADAHGNTPEAILAIFQALQARHACLDQAQISEVARALHIPARQAQGVATFYSMLATSPRPADTLRICDGPACWLRGAGDLLAAARAHPPEGWHVERTSCLGLCDHAPAALRNLEQTGPLSLPAPGEFPDPESLAAPQKPLKSPYIFPRPGESRALLAHAGEIDPGDLESALAHGAYLSLELALAGDDSGPREVSTARRREKVLADLEQSGLVGRGGAGFPTGAKWRMVAEARGPAKYVVCNADESEPLVFKDRVLIETNPHLLLEGMALAGFATGAAEGILYIRGEYQPQAQLLEGAIHQAEAKGYLGANILGSDFSFQIHLHRGAGAYICGEETALLESLEGRRGEPRLRPPYPTTHGYRGQPTLVNNVETLANVPAIVLNGPAWYRALSGAATPGTKLYTLLGHVARPGLFEAPFGLTLRQIIADFGGGMRPGSEFRFALTGGAAGTIVPPALLDTPIDYTSHKHGVSLGAGAFLICDQSISAAALVRELFHFFEMESCGKCTPCRAGTRRAREIIESLLAGHWEPGDISHLHRLATALETTSFCGLGQSASWPLRSALRYFVDDFLA